MIGLYNNEANCYLALLALKQNDIDICKAYLEMISKDADIYKKANSLNELHRPKSTMHQIGIKPFLAIALRLKKL